MYDAIVVGAGLSGSVIARYLAEEQDKNVLVLERRSHIAGNLYDSKNEVGIRIQEYGPHVFHTSDEELYQYLTRFGNWIPCPLKYKICINGKYVSNSPNFETIDTFFPESAAEIKESIQQSFPGKDKITYYDLLTCEHPSVKRFADFLYENDFRPYTKKQWGDYAEKLDRSVFDRVPFHISYYEQYWDDKYQILPEMGFTNFIAAILNHPKITVKLNVDATAHLDINMKYGEVYYDGLVVTCPLIYTGPIDELFKYKFGRLPYRSLHFDYVTTDVDSYQDEAVVAYPLEAYTRISEYKKLPPQDISGVTTIAIEYSESYPNEGGYDPYYPIPSDSSNELYELYLQESKKIQNIVLCGRLADYKYYNMDQALRHALDICDTKLSVYKESKEYFM